MAEDEEVSKTSDIAKRLGVSSSYVQLYKKSLIESGIIESVRRGEIRFALSYVKTYLKGM